MSVDAQIARLHGLLARIKERAALPRQALAGALDAPPPDDYDGSPQTVRGYSLLEDAPQTERPPPPRFSEPPEATTSRPSQLPMPPPLHLSELPSPMGSWSQLPPPVPAIDLVVPELAAADAPDAPATEPPPTHAPATERPPSLGPKTEPPIDLPGDDVVYVDEIPIHVEPVVEVDFVEPGPPPAPTAVGEPPEEERSRPRIIGIEDALAREATLATGTLLDDQADSIRSPEPVFDDLPPPEPTPRDLAFGDDRAMLQESGVLIEEEEAPSSSPRLVSQGARADAFAEARYPAPPQTPPPESGPQIAPSAHPAEDLLPEVTHADLRPDAIGFQSVGESAPPRVPTFGELLDDSLDL
jgi:hypothetical protein